MKPVIRNSLYTLLMAAVFSLVAMNSAFAHCDSMDGPVIKEAIAALDRGDVTPLLKWVPAADEHQIKAVFDKAVRVRKLGGEAQEFADQQLFTTLVKVHRAAEGAPFTGIKQAGGIDPAVMAADAALKEGGIDELVAKITRKFEDSVRERFTAALKTQAQANNSVTAGREFVQAYVQYIHYVEGVHTAVTAAGGHGEELAASEAHSH